MGRQDVPGHTRRWVLVMLLVAFMLQTADAKGGKAAAAGGGKGGGGGASSGGGPQNLVDTSSRAQTLRASLAATAARTLSSSEFKCAHVFTFSYVAGSNYGTIIPPGFYDMGDSLSRLTYGSDTANAALARLAALNPDAGGAVPIDLDTLDGANPVLLGLMSNAANFSVNVDLVRLPRALLSQGDQAVMVNYVLNTLKYDCIVNGVILDGDRVSVARFLQPHQPYSFITVSHEASIPPRSLVKILFAWTDPFAPTIWMVITISLVFTSMIMYFFEGAVNEDDFGPPEYNLFVKLGRGLNRSLSNFCCIGSYNPVTPAGQTYGVAFSFAMMLIQSAYTANLAAFFTKNEYPVQVVTSASNFAQLGLTVCMSGDPVALGLLQSNYPTTSVAVMNGTYTAMISSVNAGACAGVILPDVLSSYILGAGDPNGLFCELAQAGTETLRSGSFALAFNQAIHLSLIEQLNNLVVVLTTLGDYGSATASNFATDRSGACNGYFAQQAQLAAGSQLSSLTFTQLSGPFFLLLIGLGASIVIAMIYWAHERSKVRLEELCENDTAHEKAANRRKIPEIAMFDGSLHGHRGPTPTPKFGHALGAFTRHGHFQSDAPPEALVGRVLQQLRDELRSETAVAVPGRVARSIRGALAGGVRARGTVVLVAQDGMQVGPALELEAQSAEQMGHLYKCMGGGAAQQFPGALDLAGAQLIGGAEALNGHAGPGRANGAIPALSGAQEQHQPHMAIFNLFHKMGADLGKVIGGENGRGSAQHEAGHGGALDASARPSGGPPSLSGFSIPSPAGSDARSVQRLAQGARSGRNGAEEAEEAEEGRRRRNASPPRRREQRESRAAASGGDEGAGAAAQYRETFGLTYQPPPGRSQTMEARAPRKMASAAAGGGEAPRRVATMVAGGEAPRKTASTAANGDAPRKTASTSTGLVPSESRGRF